MFRGARLADPSLEWLEADGLGGFAMGTASGLRTRRYHGLLSVARRPPGERMLLVPAVEAWIDLGDSGGPRALSSHRYLPDATHPDGIRRLVAFTHEPWPTWTWELEEGLRVVHEVFVPRGAPEVVLCWRLVGPAPRPEARLVLRPFLALRDIHGLRREGQDLDPRSMIDGNTVEGSTLLGSTVRWRPDPSAPGIIALASGGFRPEPDWYRRFLYEEERARGFDCEEDLWTPGTFTCPLADGEASLVLTAELPDAPRRLPADVPPLLVARGLRERERERRAAAGALERAADSYLVRRPEGLSIIAGYPWFGEWGRDTFLALRGLLLARGRAEEAASILTAWAAHVSGGLLPNRFPDDAGAPEYNSVDAALWFVVAVEETLAAAGGLIAARRAVLERAALCVLEGLVAGTSWGIRADADGLLACGQPGSQLTWMDARVAGQPMTPRVGKPVEVQALWLRALLFGARLAAPYAALAERAAAAFEARFWNEERGHLNDVVDVDHVPGTFDPSLRPNQVLALGGLGAPRVAAARARRALDLLEQALWTPLGPRTLAPNDARYAGRYAGTPEERDRVYHQGPVWPWLAGPFVEAWVRLRGAGPDVRRRARERFLAPLLEHLGHFGLGHVSELADGDAPHTGRGCPFQAWSVGELLRLERVVLGPDGMGPAEAPGRNRRRTARARE